MGREAQRVDASIERRPGPARFLETIGVTALLMLSMPAWAWPEDADWVALERSGLPVVDLPDDPAVADPALDLTGDSSAPVLPTLSWFADDAALFLRIRVAGDPQVAQGTLQDAVWGVLLEADGDGRFEYAVVAESIDGVLRAYPNADGVEGTQPGFTAYGAPTGLGDLAGGQVRRVGADAGTFLVDLQLDRGLLGGLGISDTAALRFTAVTGPSIYLPWVDIAGCDTAPVDCPDLAAVQSDAVSIDRDEDGLTDPIESAIGTDPDDADSDDDGRPDGIEGTVDTDGDGQPDALDCDSDADGLRDAVESGVTLDSISDDTDASAPCFAEDADPAGPSSDPLVADTDGGGLPDGVEDWNRDGLQDPWETDPSDASDDVDTDGDGIADVLEALGTDGSVDDADSDGDGLPDADEWMRDVDGDGLPNFLDDDSDGDGLLDADEGLADLDGDGRGNFEDLDSDGDGIPDSVETLVDSDGDGTPDAYDLDSDDDDVRDAIEGADDFDGDGIPDYLDDDSDDDGLPDEVEGEDDVDDDGFTNTNDLDSDGDGIPDAVEGDDDPDNDGLGNFEDRNSDGQGANDATEGDGDGDCDGIPDWLDTDEEDSFCDPPADDPGIADAPDSPPASDSVDFASGDFTGGSCSTAGGRLAGGWALAAVLIAVARRRRVAAVGAAVLASSAASAQTLNAQRFDPTLDGQDFLQLDALQFDSPGTARFGAWVHVADDPFVFRPDGADPIDLVGTLATTDLTAAWTFGGADGRVRIGADLPVHFYAVGLGIDQPLQTGDVRLSAKARGLRRSLGSAELALGVVADAMLPTGSPSAWLGAGRTWVRAAAVGDVSTGRWRFAANLGARSGTGRTLGGLDVSPGLVWGAGAAYRVVPALVAALELDGDVWFGNGGEPGALPIEWLASAQVHPDGPAGPWTLRVGAGTGLSRGVGAPDVRVVAGLSFRPLLR
jgi:hypothetical protein